MEPRDTAFFGPFAFEPVRGELRRDGQPVQLTPRAAEVLTHLVRHQGRVVLREELLSWVWGNLGRTSADARLNSCVRRLRRTLGDDAQAPTYIETVPKRGYRFIAEVDWREEPLPASRAVGFLSPKAVAGFLAIVGFVIGAIILRPEPSVLPQGWESQYLRGRNLATAGTREEAGRGKIILLEVTRVAPGLAGAWSALAAAEATLGRLEEAERYAREAIRLNPTMSEAHRVLAETALGLRWDLDEAEVHALRAIDLDPLSPLAHSTYAYNLALRGDWERAIAYARRALSMDPQHTLIAGDLAFFLFWADRNDEAIEQARRALAIEPDLESALGALRLAYLSRGDTVAAQQPTRRLMELGGPTDLTETVAESSPTELQTAFLEWREDQVHQMSHADRWVQLAMVKAELGDHAGATEAGERALDEGAPGLPVLLIDPRLDYINSMDGFASLRGALNGAAVRSDSQRR